MLDLLDKSIGIAIIDVSETVRLEVISSLRDKGYRNFFPHSTFEDLSGPLHEGKIQWVIASLEKQQDQNALLFLEGLRQDPKQKDVQLSLLVQSSEESCVPYLFERGALSWHPKDMKRKALIAFWQELEERLGAHGGDVVLVAAHYLRNFLMAKRQRNSLLKLEQALSQLYYGRGDLLLKLGFAQMFAGSVEDGKGTLIQARLFDSKLEAKAMEILEQFGFEAMAGDLRRANLGDMGVKRAIVIDPDDAPTRQVKELLEGLGVEEVVIFHDGKSAWSWLSDDDAAHSAQLIVQEWRIPQVSGPALLQRIRNAGLKEIPIVVLSSLLSEQDFPLLAEMSVGNVVNKPIVEDDFNTTIRWAVIQERFPRDVKEVERRLYACLEADKHKEARILAKRLFGMKEFSRGRRHYVKGEFQFIKQQFEEAKKSAIESIRMEGKKCLRSLNLLGKCLIRLKDFATAMTVLEQAQVVSPQNITRLLDIAELKIINDQADEALGILDEAKKIDADHEKIYETEVKAALVAKQTERAGELMRNMQSIGHVVSYMNNRAVALAKSNRYAEATELYHSTIHAIPEDREEIRPKIIYNLAMCYARGGDLDDAAHVLAEIVSDTKLRAQPIFKKAVHLIKRIDAAKAKGVKLKFPEESAGKGSDLSELFLATASTPEGNDYQYPGSPGDSCLAGIFSPAEPPKGFVRSLLGKQHNGTEKKAG